VSRSYIIRSVSQADLQSIKNLLTFEGCVHRHMDWREAQDWICFPPYLILESIDSPTTSKAETSRKPLKLELAMLACPPDPGEVAWIRIFAFLPTLIRPREAWEQLWPPVQAALVEARVQDAAALVAERPWMENNLQSSGFKHTHNVVSMIREATSPPFPRKYNGLLIRIMREEDIPDVQAVDRACFPILWQYSATTLRLAYRTARYASVAIIEDQIVAYQITSPSTIGSHLSRLAVLPAMQGCGIGYQLTQDMLQRMNQEGTSYITVNTQDYNSASIALYHNLGFREDGYCFPVYEIPITEEPL